MKHHHNATTIDNKNPGGVIHGKGNGSSLQQGDWNAFLLQRRHIVIWVLAALIPFALVRVYFSYSSPFYREQAPPGGEIRTSDYKPFPVPQPLERQTEVGGSDRGLLKNSTVGTVSSDNHAASTGECDLSKGQWIPDSSGPFYTNETCFAIQEHQNCMKHGRPDFGYLHWRWKPDSCELPRFNASTFLELVRDKILAFIGDSIGRNHMQSLVCLLSQAEHPRDIYNDGTDKFRRWYFPSYNFTLAVLWSPFLVKETENAIEGSPAGQLKLYLDVIDEKWISELHEFDIVLLSGGQWFLKPAIYLENNEVVGCHYCPGTNFTQVGFYFAYRKALRLAFKSINASPGYKGLTLLRTFTPDHFENGRWDNGGTCKRTAPYEKNEIILDGMNAEMYKIQREEFAKAVKEGSARGLKFKLVDTTQASLLRPDGHPGPYRYPYPFANDKNAEVQNDCLHWCLPGPIDTWNEFLLELLKHE